METFENVIQAPFNTVKQTDFHLKGSWAVSFFGNQFPIVLELGCGKGEYTVELAKKFPDINFIGVDIKGARMWKGAKAALQEGLKNVAFLRTNIEIIDRFFEAKEVDEIWLTFPDPQMKRTRKRLTSVVFLNMYRRLLKSRGLIHLKTDSNFQFLYTKGLVELNNFEIISETDDLYNSSILNDTLVIKTFYEKQWLSRGITIKYLSFRLNDSEFQEFEGEIERDSYRSFSRTC